MKNASTFQWLLVATFAALLVAARVALHLPIKVPGHSGLFWMSILLVATAVVPRAGAATATAGLASILAVFVGVGDRGAVATVLAYLAAGAGVDAVRALTRRRESLAAFGLAGLAGNLAKLGVMSGLEIFAGVPVGFVLVGRAWALVTYTAFGILGGVLGLLVVRALRRAGYFAYLEGRR